VLWQLSVGINIGFTIGISAGQEQPAEYYRTTADRYRKLLAETTTLGLTQYLGEMIARCERLAREIEGAF
jgi:hypothetical protein